MKTSNAKITNPETQEENRSLQKRAGDNENTFVFYNRKCMATNEIIETAKSQEGRKATPQYQDEIGQGEGVPQNKAQENEGNSNQGEMIRNVDEW